MYGRWCGICGSLFVVLRLQPLHQLFFAELVVDADVPHAGPGQQRVALFHLLDGPGQNRLGLAHVGDDRVHQVRQRLVGAELDHLGVDHQHPHFVGPARHQHRHDDRVQAHALAGAGAAGDQQVRQRRQVDDHRIAGHVLAQVDRDAHLLGLAVGLFDHFAQADELPLGVGHFDADGVLAGNRRDDAHARHAQRDRQIVGQAGDLRQPQAGFELDFELRDDRPGLDLDDFDVEAEVEERLFQDLGLAADFFFVLFERDSFARQQQIDRRQLVFAPALPIGWRLRVPRSPRHVP